MEAESLHAALRLTLRLTREHKYAVLFADLGGPRILLSLNQSSSFHGFVSLVTLIFRHILEEKDSLRYCMEKVCYHSITLQNKIPYNLQDMLKVMRWMDASKIINILNLLKGANI